MKEAVFCIRIAYLNLNQSNFMFAILPVCLKKKCNLIFLFDVINRYQVVNIWLGQKTFKLF